MKYNFTKKLIINTTLDSSETVMFNQGGMHKVVIQNDEDDPIYFDEYDSIEITVQLDRNHMGRHDFIMNSARSSIKSLTPEEIAARQRDAQEQQKREEEKEDN